MKEKKSTLFDYILVLKSKCQMNKSAKKKLSTPHRLFTHSFLLVIFIIIFFLSSHVYSNTHVSIRYSCIPN